jgi:hypothetical protein
LSQEISGGTEENELVVVFSAAPLNLYKNGVGKDVFRKLTPQTRSTVVRAAGYLAGFATYKITD